MFASDSSEKLAGGEFLRSNEDVFQGVEPLQVYLGSPLFPASLRRQWVTDSSGIVGRCTRRLLSS